MKKLSKRNILFLTFSFSVIISAAIAIPLGIRAHSRTFDAGLLAYNEKLDGAINLSNQEDFDQNEFVKLAKTLKIKDNFAKKFSALDALELHFDKFYSFDLNDIVDFSPILAKFPNFKLKLVVPPKKDQVKIEKNSLKNLAINAISPQKITNFSTEVELQFNSDVEKLEVNPENLSLVFQFSNSETTKNKTAVELAIALQKKFSENFKKNTTEIAALFKTLPNFGGISVLDQKKDQVILPNNLEIRPKLQNEKLVFTKVDNVDPKLELQLSLVDKNTNKERDVFLEFTNFPKISNAKQEKIQEIFKKNYKFKSNLARILTFFNLMPSQAIFKNLPEKLQNHSEFQSKKTSDFDFWYQINDSNSLLNEIKQIVPENFSAESVKFEIENKKFDEKELKSFQEKHQIPLVLSVSGKFKEESLIPVGIEFSDKNQFSYKFGFLDDLSDSIYSASLENALNPLDESGKIKENTLNLEDLKFEVKQNLPTTIFASTFDETISEWKNKPLDLKNIDKTLKPLFDLLNSSVKLEEKEKTLANKVSVSTTLFAENENESSRENSKKPGDILKETLDRIAKTPMLENRSVFLSSEFSDKYNLVLDIKDGNVSEKTLKFPIESVLANNKPFELLQKNTNLHLFLDWKSNLKTTSKIHKGQITDPRNYLDSITTLNDSGLKFVPGQPEEAKPEESEIIYPFKSQAYKGIYITNQGLKLEKVNKTSNHSNKNIKNMTLFYVFKPSGLFYPPWINFSLLKSSNGKTEKPPSSNGNENSLNLIIRSYFAPGFNLVGADFGKKPEEIQLLQEDKPGALIKPTFNGELNLELRPDGQEIGLSKIVPNNEKATNQDFLNNSDATVMLKLKVEDEEGKKGKSNAKLSFYTTESTTPYKPVWEIEQKGIDFSGFSTDNDLKLGYLPAKEQNEQVPYLGAIILKSLAIFENSKTIDDKQIAKSFIDEYFDLKQKN